MSQHNLQLLQQPTKDLINRVLTSSVVRACDQYLEGHGFNSSVEHRIFRVLLSTHIILMAKCSLGKVQCKPYNNLLLSSFWGSLIPSAGAPCDLLQAVACLQFFTKCLHYSLVAFLTFSCFVFPNQPSLFIPGLGKYWLVSIPLNSSVRWCLVQAACRPATNTSIFLPTLQAKGPQLVYW